MAIRRWAARPDQLLTLRSGEELPVVSREQMREGYMDGEALMAQAGGVFTVYCARVRTDVDGEMVTTGAVFEWKDRADARPQPEPETGVRPAAAPAAEQEPELEMEDEDALEPITDEDGEPIEDLSAIPAHLQAAV